jgi:hypothetical protein
MSEINTTLNGKGYKIEYRVCPTMGVKIEGVKRVGILWSTTIPVESLMDREYRYFVMRVEKHLEAI